MRKIQILYFLFLTGLVFSCSAPTKEEGQEEIPEDERLKKELFDQARSLHDEMMPYLDSIFQSRDVINEELERAAEGIKEVQEQRKRALEEITEELDDARESMMDWMRNYSRMPADTLANELVIKRLELSLEKIENTKSKMLESLQKAQSILSDSID